MESEDLEDGNRFAEISDAWYMEDLLPLDESAGHIPPDPQSAEDTSRAVALRQAAHASFPSAVTSVEEVLAMIRKLEAHMDQNPLSARELPAALVSSVDRSIQITQSRFLDSPASGGGSPHSDGGNAAAQSKRRKGTPCVKRQRRAASVQDAAALDDGLSWRKYGQKDILGANKYPRSARTRHGAGMPEIPHSGSALLDFNMREINVALTPTLSVENPPREPTPLVVSAGLTVPQRSRTGIRTPPGTPAALPPPPIW